ncbi:MAG TPA: AAA family ATPase [Terriglobia bacterium]|nr:AAA family ATPase [Terriglobia bacterium]
MANNSKTGRYLNLVTVGLDEHSLAQIRLFANSMPIAHLQAEFPQYAGDDNELTFSEQPDVCVIDFDQDPDSASRLVRRILELLPGTAVLATSWGADPNSIVRAMQCGCSDYLLKPLDQRMVLKALSRLTRDGENAHRVNGQVLCFIGAKGGCGTTMLAVHLSEFLVKLHGRRTLLVDHHPGLGDVSLYLGLDKHRYHFRDLLENTHRLDAQLVQGFVVRHSSGLDVLSAPTNFELGHDVSPEAIEHVFEFLRAQYQFVLVDCPPGLGPENMMVAKASDQVYLVATPELPALQRAAKYFDELRSRRYDGDRIRAVINRDSANKGRSAIDRAEKLLAAKIDWRIPNQYHEVMRTLNIGVPLRPSADVTRSLSRWAAALAEERPGTPRRPANAKRGQGDVLSLRTAECG